MQDHIGIDTHGYDQPPDTRDFTPDEESRIETIESQIADLVNEYRDLTGTHPHISGYRRTTQLTGGKSNG